VDGEPPDLPAESYSEAARNFVRGCLNKIPKLRPTYAMLIRHGWLAPLMKPPTINEEEEEEAAAEAGHDTMAEQLPETADKEVANWVKAAIERKISGKMAKSEKPALHAAPLDAMPRSPVITKDSEGSVNAVNGPTETEAVSHIAPSEAVKVESPELKMAHVDSMDFAGGVEEKGEAA
jgi:mitogen-activated protein kinase kinase